VRVVTLPVGLCEPGRPPGTDWRSEHHVDWGAEARKRLLSIWHRL